MNAARRRFVKNMAVAGAVVSTGHIIYKDSAGECAVLLHVKSGRCPYFDQPMYCKGLSETGGPFCDE